jgi:oxalate decarboxylase/phosphoglucose isomerase-like protein (cupin superfamily)
MVFKHPMSKKFSFTTIVFASLLVGAFPAYAASDTISITQADELQWQDYPGLPGVKFVVVAGNPREAGPYTIRAKFSPGVMSKPHWHPEARFVTVMQGKVHYDGAKDEEVIVQISGIGPSGTNIVNPTAEAK